MTSLLNDIPSQVNSPQDLLCLLATSTSGRVLVDAPTGAVSTYRIRHSSGALVTGSFGGKLLGVIREALIRGDEHIFAESKKIAIEFLREGRLLLFVSQGCREVLARDDTRPTEAPESHAVAIVDDDPAYLAVLTRMVSKLEIKAIRIPSADAAFSSLLPLEKSLSAVILDLHLPEKERGLEVLRFIRLQSQWEGLPVIILTSDESDDSRREAIALGASFVLTKRLDTTTLSNLIARITKQKVHESCITGAI